MSYVGNVTAGGSTHLVGSTLYGTCSTAASTAAKVVTCADFDHLFTGVTIHVKFTNGNTVSNATLNVNSTGAKPLCRYGTTRVGTTTKAAWSAGAVVSFTYDGTSWIMNDYIEDTDTHKSYTFSGTMAPSSQPGTASLAEFTETFTNVTDSTTQTATQRVGVLGDYMALIYLENNGVAFEVTNVTSTIASGSSQLATSGGVYTAIQNAMGDVAGALVYKGTLGTGGTIESLPANHTKGWYYIVYTAGTYAGVTCEPGDMVICNTSGTTADNSHWDVIQTNIETISNSDIDTIVAS
jgi:hypothetical protein